MSFVDGAPDRLRVRVEQSDCVLGDPPANLERIRRAQADAAADRVDLLVTPELSLTGYDLRDRTRAVARPADELRFPELAGGPDVVLGAVERGPGFVPYNVGVHLRGGVPLHRHRKIYLPTYGMFDEARWFGHGDRVRAYDAGGGWRMGLLVCEDLWHPSTVYLLAMAGVHLAVVQVASVGRGTWSGGASGRFASWDAWEHIACAAAHCYGIYLVVANRAGVEGPAVFAGGSLIVGPDGRVIARGADDGEDRVDAELSLAAVGDARSPFAHARDEDPHLVSRELAAILAEGR